MYSKIRASPGNGYIDRRLNIQKPHALHAIADNKSTQQPPTEVGGLVTYGLKVRIRVD